MTTKIISKLAPKNDGYFPTHSDIHGEGGFQVRLDLTDRDNIPSLNRKEGMWVKVVSDGYVYTLSGGISNLDWQQINFGGATFTASGDLSGTTSSQNVINIHGASVPLAGALVTGNILQVSGASSLTYSSLNLAGGTNYVTGLLPNTNQDNQVMAGDVTGTTGTSTVTKLQNIPISAIAPLDGYVLKYVSIGSSWQPKLLNNKKIITTSNSYSINPTDEVIIVSTNAGGITIILPLSPSVGDNYCVKDGAGNSHTNNIIINGNGNNIDGSSTFIIKLDYSSILLAYSGIEWSII